MLMKDINLVCMHAAIYARQGLWSTEEKGTTLIISPNKNMMHPQVPQSYFQQDLDQAGLYGLKAVSYAYEDHDFYSPEQSSIITSDSYFQTILPCDFGVTPNLGDDQMQFVFPTENISQHVEGIEGISGPELEDALRWWGESVEMDTISSEYSMENKGICSDTILLQSIDLSWMLPLDDMEVEGETSLCHLFKAYGEAIEMGHTELAKVIIGCINEKASPVRGTMARLAFNLFHSGNLSDYIKQESRKNFKVAFKAFYEIFPYGRLSHFAANSVILEAIMNDSGKVHIIDFDMGEGLQWPAILESLGKLRKETKLTSIRTSEQSYGFEDVKNKLLDYARTCGLKLEIQEIEIGDLVRVIEESKEHEFLAFNCNVGLPHMGRRTNRSQVKEFLKVAKKLLLTNNGIITFADGEDVERFKYCDGYSSFFDKYLMHYQALCESIEEKFPDKLTEARIVMESLFVAPYVSSLSWHQKWEDVKEDLELNENHGLIGWKLRKESLMEAKEMVKERQSSYTIRVEGENGNEMVLDWRGTPMVRISAWKQMKR